PRVEPDVAAGIERYGIARSRGQRDAGGAENGAHAERVCIAVGDGARAGQARRESRDVVDRLTEVEGPGTEELQAAGVNRAPRVLGRARGRIQRYVAAGDVA